MNPAYLVASLAAVIILYVTAGMLKLGGDVRVHSEEDALALAEAEGFAATGIAVDRAGIGALARDADGRHMLIRRHGVHFVSRILSAPLDARLDKNFLTIGTNEPSFGRITLDLGAAAADWAASLRRVK